MVRVAAVSTVLLSIAAQHAERALPAVSNKCKDFLSDQLYAKSRTPRRSAGRFGGRRDVATLDVTFFFTSAI